MPAEFPAREVSPLVGLFQKAHGRISQLHRLDEQIASMQDQRRRLQEEVRAIQQEINNEFERVMKGRSGRGERREQGGGGERQPIPAPAELPANGDEVPSLEDMTEAISLEALSAAARMEGKVERKPR